MILTRTISFLIVMACLVVAADGTREWFLVALMVVGFLVHVWTYRTRATDRPPTT